MKKIKIGQIGISHEHAHGKITTLKNMPDIFEIVGVVDDRNTSKGARFVPENYLKSYEGMKFMTEEELFKVPGLQAVTVEVPNSDLVPTALRCMEHNLAMHMDKPGGEDLELFRKLRKGYADRGLPFQMGYMFRGNPAVQFCKRIVSEGWLGDIYEIQATMSHNYGNDVYHEYLSTFKGGIMFNLGCHLIDFIVSMMGRPEKITPFLKSTPGIRSEIKNNCLTILEYPNATVSLRASSIELGASDQGGRPLKICGTNGTAYLCPMECFNGQPLKLHLSLREARSEYAAGSHVIEFAARNDRYKEQLFELAKVINGEVVDSYDYEHDCLVQEVLLTASGFTEFMLGRGASPWLSPTPDDVMKNSEQKVERAILPDRTVFHYSHLPPDKGVTKLDLSGELTRQMRELARGAGKLSMEMTFSLDQQLKSGDYELSFDYQSEGFALQLFLQWWELDKQGKIIVQTTLQKNYKSVSSWREVRIPFSVKNMRGTPLLCINTHFNYLYKVRNLQLKNMADKAKGRIDISGSSDNVVLTPKKHPAGGYAFNPD